MSANKFKKLPPLSTETAEQMLQNIFRSCKKTANTVSLQTLTAYSNYRKERFALQRTVIIVILSLFALLPLLFLSTSITIIPDEKNDTHNPVFHIQLSSSAPVRHLTAQIDGVTQPVYDDGQGRYTVTPGQNGEMIISATLFNLQVAKENVMVSGVDYTLPRLIKSQRVQDSLRLYFDDADSGIDALGISVTDENGNSLHYQYNSDSNRLSIAYVDTALNVDVPDNRGNVLHLLLSPQ